MSEPVTPFVQRVILRNYKSIRHCDVSLGPLTFLVGANGSGKSNFLDALRFVGESLRNSIQHAFGKRGGPMEVFSRLGTELAPLEIDLKLNLPGGQTASFRFVALPKPPVGFVIEEEDCEIQLKGKTTAAYKVRGGEVIDASFELRPPVSKDRLYLIRASGIPEFRELYDLLEGGVLYYKINPERIRQEPFIADGGTLRTAGDGLGTVLRRIADSRPELKERIDEYLRAILPALGKITVESFGEMMQRLVATRTKQMEDVEKYYLRFVLLAGDQQVTFEAQHMSDGTLHALGVLVALFQCVDQPPERTISLVGIEEPEATVHPAAAGVLFDALHEASHFIQTVATTHSAELLNIKHLDPHSLLVVDMVDGETIIGPADDVSLSAMKDRLYMAGELLEMNQLKPNPKRPENAETGDDPHPQSSSEQ